jgi:hypothetical protein
MNGYIIFKIKNNKNNIHFNKKEIKQRLVKP